MQLRLFEQLQQVVQVASYSKLQRFLHNPIKYIKAIGYRKIVYPLYHKPYITHVLLFFNTKMVVALPASTDIYLAGGKTHISETKLAAFLIKQLKPNHCFLDIGAHYGYYTLLAAELVGNNGYVMAYEPTPYSFNILHMNVNTHNHIIACMQAVSYGEAHTTLYSFDNIKSEYNTINKASFEQTSWSKKARPIETIVIATSIDAIINTTTHKPNIIKIDVEGGEYNVIQGGQVFLHAHAPIVVMEYVCKARNNDSHAKAALLLTQMGYKTFAITTEGLCLSITNIDDYLTAQQLESDNIVFMKSNM